MAEFTLTVRSFSREIAVRLHRSQSDFHLLRLEVRILPIWKYQVKRRMFGKSGFCDFDIVSVM